MKTDIEYLTAAKEEVAKRYNQFVGQPYQSWPEMEECLINSSPINLIERLNEAAIIALQNKGNDAPRSRHKKVDGWNTLKF